MRIAPSLKAFLLSVVLSLGVFCTTQAVLPGSACAAPTSEEVEHESLLKGINEVISSLLFYDISGGNIQVPRADADGNPLINSSGQPEVRTIQIPFLLAFLLFGAIFFTFWFRFVNIRAFWHAIDVVRGRYDNAGDHGEVSHFQALTSALSATVGLGNIAGVAVAIQLGGPGAVVWMSIISLFSMSAKFSSCTLAQLYRKAHKDGSFSGGPMYYLDIGFRESGFFARHAGKFLAVLYALLVMAGSLGAGSMFQSNQAAESLVSTFELESNPTFIIGVILALAVGAVTLGGIKRIGAATSKIVPLMCGIYILAAIAILIANFSKLPAALILMWTMAFTNNAAFGGFLGVLLVSVQRAVFSNEGGLGSAAIAHAAARTNEPVREGMVAMLGPVIDTMLVCTITALVVIVSGVWNDPALSLAGEGMDSTLTGVTLTSAAFATVIPWFPYVLTVCILLFAYSSMISWCYYGERGWIYLLDHFREGFGLKTVPVFRIAFLITVVIGAVEKLADVLHFSDVLLLAMALPNILGSIFLAPRVSRLLKDYMYRYKTGQMSRTK